jgi:hypothetical protein
MRSRTDAAAATGLVIRTWADGHRSFALSTGDADHALAMIETKKARFGVDPAKPRSSLLMEDGESASFAES